MNKPEENIIICNCGHLDHSIIIQYDEYAENDKELTISLKLIDNGFFFRLKEAWKYLFKKPSYPYDTIILNKDHKDKFQYIVDKLNSL